MRNSLRCRTAAALVALLAAVPLAAQGTRLDPGREQSQAGIMMMRDSLVPALGAVAQLQRDYQKAQPATLEGYARQVTATCAAAERTWPAARTLVADAALTTVDQQRAQGEMVASFDRLKPALIECQRTFEPLGQPGKGEEVRGYGNRRAEPVRRKLEGFNRSLTPFIRSLKLDARTVLHMPPSPYAP
ncbi:MAG: hypothetical protein MUC69_04345 [Gemmatimonadales bacterium]|jgi:hypothetical protein|nr:hypothetical protein [Gemmatimonadales bacterium]